MIYIHIPFCRRKCNYCAFNSKTSDASERSAYVEALIEEINLRGDKSHVATIYFGGGQRDVASSGRVQVSDKFNSSPRPKSKTIETIYFGGGTPTTLTINQLEKILGAVRKAFNVDERAELTIEANPGTVDENYLRGLKSLGFNRLSLGVQSFNDELLKTLGRIHTSRAAIETIALAKNFFANVSVDLMYGLPCQRLEDLRRDLERIKALDVRHVSIYGLEIEEGTKFFELARAGKLALPDEDTCADMYDLITETLPAFGYRRYEISNFAKEGFESRHNVGYWTGKSYFGFGAGAHSFDGNLRTSNVRDVSAYIKGTEPIVEEVITRQAAMEEFCFLGLRMINGISAQMFKEKFGASIFDVFGGVMEKNRRLGLLEVDGDKIFLTKRGLALGNEVFADFLL